MAKGVCPFCSHKQEIKSKLYNITCSSCRKKYPNPFSKPISKKKVTDPINNTEKEKDFVDEFNKETEELIKEGGKVTLD